MKLFIRGLRSGIPIGVGYLSVSFSFGILAVSYGFQWWQALIISMTTVTSAGQLAGIGIMVNPAQYLQMLLSVDVHGPCVLRANMPPRNFEEWYETFDVKETDGMYLAPEKRIVIW